MAITTKEQMFGDNGVNGLQAPFSNTAPSGYGVNNRAIGFGEQLTSAVANRTHYALALNDEDLDSRLTTIETDGLDAAYRQGALAVPGGGRVITKDGGAVEIQSAQATPRVDDRADALMRVDASGDTITNGIGYDAIVEGTVLLGRRTFVGSTNTSVSSTSGTLNPAAAGATLIQADVGDVFHTSGDMDLLRGVDLIEIVDTVYAGLYRVHAAGGADNQLILRHIDGTSPTFAANTAVTFYLRRPIVALGLTYHPGNSLQSTKGNLFVGTPGARTVVDVIPMMADSFDPDGAQAALRVFQRLVDGSAAARAIFDRYGVLALTPDPATVDGNDVDTYLTGLLPATFVNFDTSVSTTHMGMAVRGLVDAIRYDVSLQGPLITPNKNYSSSSSGGTFALDSATGTIFLNIADFTGADTTDVLPHGCLVRVSGASSGNGLYVLYQRIADNEIVLRTLSGGTAVFPTTGVCTLHFYSHQAIGRLPALAAVDETGSAVAPVIPSAMLSAGGADGATALALTAPRTIAGVERYFLRGVVGDTGLTDAVREVFSVDSEGAIRGSAVRTTRRGSAAAPVDPLTGFTGLTLIAENIQDGGNQRHRTYISVEGTIWETINAAWDGSVWSYDALGGSCAILRGSSTSQRAVVQLLYRSGIGTWNTNEWDRTVNIHTDYVQLFGQNNDRLNLDPNDFASTTTATAANTLYPSAIVKNWARLAIAAGPAVSVTGGMGITSASLVSANTEIQLVLTTAFDNASSMCPMVSFSGATLGRTLQVTVIDTTTLRVTKFNGTSAEAFANGDVVFFHIVGVQ